MEDNDEATLYTKFTKIGKDFHYDKESLVSFVEKKVKEATSRNERSMERKYKTEEADRVENEKKAAARIRW